MKDEREKAANEPTASSRDADAQTPSGSGRAGGYSVSLPEFDGPLDLLLSLIQEHELDILDIPIGFIATKYVEYITLMQQLNIDLASEYLVMAATLAHIKSKMLLPAPPEDQEEGDEIDLDPRAELVRRLLEYQKYKHVAEQLANRELLGRDVFVRAAGNPIPEGQAPLAPVTLFKLLEAFKRVLDRAHQFSSSACRSPTASTSSLICSANGLASSLARSSRPNGRVRSSWSLCWHCSK
jgi:segregation and condensation protein A